MHRRPSRLALAVLGLASVAWPSPSRAETAKPVTWWIAPQRGTCSAHMGPLAREVQLACDATHRCALASDEGSADRRAALVCGQDGWTLEARDAKDQPLWTLALGATDDDARLREAGVWIARSEGDDPMDLPASTTAAATRASPPPLSPAVVPEPDRTPDDPRGAHLSFAVMFHGSSPRSSSQDYGLAWGGRALLVGSAPRLAGPLFVGIAGTAEYSAEKADYSLVRGGLIVGLNASVGDFRFGLSIEGGPALLDIPHAPSDGSVAVNPGFQGASNHDSALSTLLPYAQASLLAQWSLRGPIHPFLSPSVTWMIDRGADFTSAIPNAMAGLDIGFVWGRL